MAEQGTLVRSKGSSFLNSFWDLVSDCGTTREQAAAYITNYLTKGNKQRSEEGKEYITDQYPFLILSFDD